MTASVFPADVAGALALPLDPDRIRIRKGRGGGQFSYLAGHDVKRRASELFGFGNWGHEVVSLDEIGYVPVEGKSGPGVHVGYRCVVRVWITTHDNGVERSEYRTEGVGYGDGVEYGPAARITACELAIKEAETDGLKRAFTDLGDQFGLILYAKEDEVRRIEADRDAPPPPRPNRPKGWPELTERWRWLFGGPEQPYAVATASSWTRQAAEELYGPRSFSDLSDVEKAALGDVLAEALLDLEDGGGPLDMATGARAAVQAALATYLDGVVVPGPGWSMGAEEAEERPQYVSLGIGGAS
jgi:hypothetical protein